VTLCKRIWPKGTSLTDCALNQAVGGAGFEAAVQRLSACLNRIDEVPEEVQSLLNVYSQQDDLCRDAPLQTEGDGPRRDRSCGAREATFRRIFSLGYCYGKIWQMAEVDKEWHRCGPDSIGAPA
jgi:hypothetical protein